MKFWSELLSSVCSGRQWWDGGGLTGVRPVVVLHGRQVEEGVVAGRPGALVRLLPAVQFLVVVQGPFFTEGAIAQVAFVLPGGEEAEGESGGGQENPELFTDPKADVKHQTKQRREGAGFT